jgi:hypothetical protein
MVARSHDNRPALNYDQFAEAGPSPTSNDAFSTIAHLADSAAFNAKHGALHHYEAQKITRKLPDSVGDLRDQIIWELDHSTKHGIACHEDLESLVKHVKTNKYLKPAALDLAEQTQKLQAW